MKPLDMPPKTSRRLNQVKVMTNYTHSKHDNTLETTLIQWRQNVHAEFWGGKIDHFLGPVALISDEIIEDLCHLSHAHAIHCKWYNNELGLSICYTSLSPKE